MQSCQSNVEFISCGTGAPDAQDKNYKSQDFLNNRSNHGHRLQEFCVLPGVFCRVGVIRGRGLFRAGGYCRLGKLFARCPLGKIWAGSAALENATGVEGHIKNFLKAVTGIPANFPKISVYGKIGFSHMVPLVPPVAIVAIIPIL